MSKEYWIPVTYSVYCKVRVEANSLDEAIEDTWANEYLMPQYIDGIDYIEGNWKVEEAEAREEYKENEEYEE